MSVPRNNQNRPRRTAQDAFGDGPFPEPPPSSPSVGAHYDDIDVPGCCVKHDQRGGIAVLLLDAHLHACGLRAFPKLGEVVEPLARAPGERNGGGCCVKKKELRLPDHRETERTIERSFARLLEIDRAENACKRPHAITSVPAPAAERRQRRRYQARRDFHSAAAARRSRRACLGAASTIAWLPHNTRR